MGMVTIATNMAGRGTDILLGGNADFMARQDLVKRQLARAARGCRRSGDPSVAPAGMVRFMYQSQEFETTQADWDAACSHQHEGAATNRT